MWGDPIYVPKEALKADIEEKRRELEAMLNELTEKAERICGGSCTTC